MMNHRERKIICFGVAIGILCGVIGMKLLGASGTVVLAALIFLVPLVPEVRAQLCSLKTSRRAKAMAEPPHAALPHLEMPHVRVPHVEMPDFHVSEETKEELAEDWLSNRAIVIYSILFLISFLIGYVVLN
ncbi:hypothetical protein [Mitsuokella jalaludinii]|uniref:hypothetical protein n=1 Tax=Mitsuokella jalaludinii TaxID=187979 RepID=UPI003F98FF07